MQKKKIVVVGGGTGTHTVLRGLRHYVANIDIAAVVTMTDSGGSTGRLRDEFGFLPIGDVRNVLTALASESEEDHILMRELFLYRFTQGAGLLGHNFGNLFLTALTDMLGSEEKAILAASRILKIAGRVIPVTTDTGHLKATYSDGQVIIGENKIEELELDGDTVRIIDLEVTPTAVISDKAKTALLEADLIVFGPGDLYTSILANCVVEGFREAVLASQARVAYVCNLMSKQGQTSGMHAKEHIDELARYIGRLPDVVFINNAPLQAELVRKYEQEGDHPILNNCVAGTCTIMNLPLVSSKEVVLQNGDVIKRNLIRHDSHALARALIDILPAM
jgi:uncharacterized cofD-like protein